MANKLQGIVIYMPCILYLMCYLQSVVVQLCCFVDPLCFSCKKEVIAVMHDFVYSKLDLATTNALAVSRCFLPVDMHNKSVFVSLMTSIPNMV